MTFLAWVLVGFTAFSTLVTVSQVGKPRPSITPAVAVGVIVFNCLYIAGWLRVAGVW